MTLMELNEKNTQKIGMIYPPLEVRNIVDKTASFVSRNGPDFESRIRQNEINNPKFNFLVPSDPYHTYYQLKVKEFSEGIESEVPALKIPQNSKLTQDAPKAITEVFVPKEPPKEFEYIYDPPSIAAQDIDIVKLTAQFVARNGRQFLTQLMSREQRNYQFDFLRAQHSMFGYFTKLVEQYTKILIPPKDLVKHLQDELDAPDVFMKNVHYRVDWQRHEERQRKREEEAAEKDRIAYAMIDWHDFVVVESVDFQRNELGTFPAPTTPDEVGARIIARERGNENEALLLVPKSMDAATTGPRRPPPVPGIVPDVDLDEDDGMSDEESKPVPVPQPMAGGDDMELSDEEMDTLPPPPPPPRQPVPEPQFASEMVPPSGVVVVKNYNPKGFKPQADLQQVMMVSPFSGEKIPLDQAPKHVRVGLLDPKWVEQKDREVRLRQEEDQVFATGTSIGSNLKQLAQQRSDIFVSGSEKEAKNRLPTDRLQWDGHAGSKDTLQRMAMRSVTEEQRRQLLQQQIASEQELNRISAHPDEPTTKKPRQ
ncbi:splicing factor 3a, subunit 1 [Cichlidogyrus casuarinus]|uniref:Splicing factor 3a, subunit 1 n=1 Tax=Cichlidogyrus casuarinus TaxID=1844966 RepID=A0ABD2QKX6_9PLAT